MRRCRASLIVLVVLAALVGAPGQAFAATPPNDNFANAQTIVGTSGSVDGNLADATVEPAEPVWETSLPSIWYRWTAPESGLFRFDTSTGVLKADLWLYTGSSLSELAWAPKDWCPPASAYDLTTHVLHATAGVTYSFRLTGYAGSVVEAGRTTLKWARQTRPANDNFTAATPVAGFEPVLAGNNCAASAEPGESLDQYTSRRTVWFSWTPTVTVTEMLPDVEQHLIVTVYTGSSVSALTRVARSADVHGAYGASFTAKAGTTYRIQVDSQGNPGHGIAGPQLPFTVALHKVPPYNDAFSSYDGLADDWPLPLTGSVVTENVYATAEAGEPAHAGSPASHSLWWRIVPPVTATVTLSTTGSSIDTVLGVYTGTRVDALTRVVADDDSAGAGASRVTFRATGGTAYIVAVDGKAGAEGQVRLAWRLDIPPPRNDMFANAIALTSGLGTSQSYTWSASKEPGEPAHEGFAGGRSVWWRYTAPATGRLHLVGGGGNDSALSVYRGSSVSALTRVAGARQWFTPAVVDVDVSANVTYHIAIDVADPGYGNLAGLNWSSFPPRPPNDDIAKATLISGASGAVDGHDVGATQAEVDEPSTMSQPNSSVFYRWTAPSSGPYVFNTLTSDYNTDLWIYRGWGSSLAPLPLVAHNDDAVDWRMDPNDYRDVIGSDHTSAVGLNAVAGQVYTILIDGAAYSQGRFRLQWAPAPPWTPPNDMFAAAQPLSGASGSVTAHLAESTWQPGEPQWVSELCCSVWYTWTAPASGQVVFWISNQGASPVLSVYTGATLQTLTPVAENGVGVATVGARVTIDAVAGTTYRIRLALDTGLGAYWPAAAQLLWGPPPPPPANDAFAAAPLLSGAAGSVDGTCQWATREPGEPNPEFPPPVASVWYRWTAPTTGTASFWIQGRGMSPEAAVYTGSRVDALALLEGIGTPGEERRYDGVRITFPTTAGVTYAIQVQGSNTQGGPFRMLWNTRPPPHDNLANALPLSGARGVSPADDWTATTIRATTEPGEPGYDPTGNRVTVWFRWTAPASGPVTFSVAETSASNVLTAYTGTTYGSLTQVARTDYGWWHEMRWDAVAGTTYLISGYTYSGQLRVRWSQYADQVKPSGTVVINGGAASTTNRMATLTLNATDNVGVTGVRISNSDRLQEVGGDAGAQQWLTRGADVDGNPVTVRWSLTDLFYGGNNAAGTKTVYVQWRDAQGNWSPVARDTIVANLPPIGDTLPPTGSVTINAGAAYTSSPSVQLSMPATDLWTGVALMRISNRPDTNGGILVYGPTLDWTATPQPWSLADPNSGGSTANGTRTVYVQFRDGAGNWSPAYTDTIVLDTVAPAARAPTAVPAGGATVGTSVPTTVRWSATDATSGVAAYQLEQSVDGGAWARISLPAPLTTSTVRALAPGHTYRFRSRASDRAGLWSGWQYGPTLTPALHQETSAALGWSGTWTRSALAGASGGYVRSSTQAGARATFTATMRAAGWVAVRGPNRGKATMYVDGVAVATVDLYATSVQPARVVFVRSWTSPGTHAVAVRVAGTAGRPRVDVDAFVMLR